MGSRGVDVPLSALRSAERAVQRVRRAEVLEWYRRLCKAIADAERTGRACSGRQRHDGPNHYRAARIAARSALAGASTA